MIEIRKLSKTYEGMKEKTLDNVSLALPSTGLYFLVGKSGSGKSTFLTILGGMDVHYDGTILLDGSPLPKEEEEVLSRYRFERIAFVFQELKAEENESVENNVAKGLHITDCTMEERRERVGKALREVGLLERRKARFKDLSGGEKKRIALARALVQDGDILLADEPLASLDPGMRARMMAVLKREGERRLVLVITHEEREIPREAGLLRMEGKSIKKERDAEKMRRTPRRSHYKRKPFFGIAFFRELMESFISKRAFLLIAVSSLVVSLFAICFSFLLSGSVKEAMTGALSTYMDRGAMVIDCTESGVTKEGYRILGFNMLKNIARAFPEDVLAVSPFYVDSLNDIFEDRQEIRFLDGRRSVPLPSLSLDSFLQFALPSEMVHGYDDKVDLSSLSYEEVLLCLDEDSMIALYVLLFHEEPLYGITDKALQDIRSAIWYEGLSLSIEAHIGEWGYYLDHSIEVRDVVLSEETMVVSPIEDFSEYFVSRILQFTEIAEGEEKTVPWSVSKVYGLRLRPGRNGAFLKAFLSEERYDGWTLSVLRQKPYYDEKEDTTHNRLLVYEDYLPHVSLAAIRRFSEDHAEDIRSVCYSSPVYTYTASGFVSGFAKPFFFSPEKEKLNAVMDEGSKSEENLGAFQGSAIQVPEGVLKADLLSSMEEGGLRFYSLDQSREKPLLGRAPKDETEIALTVGMADALYGVREKAIGSPLHCLTLDRIVQEGDGYRNIFSEGHLTVVGIYGKEEIGILHESLFPLCYAFRFTTLGMEDVRIDQAVIDCDLDAHPSSFYMERIKGYGDFSPSFPMEAMTKEVEKILDLLSAFFLAFSVLSLLNASFLFLLALYLVLLKDKKSIGILLSLGYEKKEILRFYVFMAAALGLVSFLLAALLSLFCQNAIRDTLGIFLSTTSFSLFPYAVSFLTMAVLVLLLALSIGKVLSTLTPKEAFLKG